MSVMRNPRPALGYDDYLRLRGYDPDRPVAFIRRMFVAPWSEPGFHRFWRLWNPLFGYALYRLFLLVGGSRRPRLASFVTFAASGFVFHDLLRVILGGRASGSTTLAFVVFWALATTSKVYAPRLHQEHWPRGLNILTNIVMLGLGLLAGDLLASLVSRP